MGGVINRVARRSLTVLSAFAVAFGAGLAQAEPDPGWGGPDDPWPAVAHGAVIPGFEDVHVDFACPEGAGKALIVDIGAGRTYAQCIKTWHSAEWYRLVEEERAAYDAVKEAAYQESLRLNTQSPGTQTCVPYTFQWRWAGSGEESGGVCANVVSPPSADDTAVTTPTPIPDPTPIPTPTPDPTPAPPPDPGSDDTTVEPMDSIRALALPTGRWRIEVTTAEVTTLFRVVATHPTSDRRLVWRQLTSDADGEFRFQTSRDLTGFKLRLVVGDQTVARTLVTRPTRLGHSRDR